jgi:MraZ protein
VDKQGRILIPAKLREFAGLEKDVTMIGVGGRVEIWNPDRLEDNSTFEDMDEIAEHMAELGI